MSITSPMPFKKESPMKDMQSPVSGNRGSMAGSHGAMKRSGSISAGRMSSKMSDSKPVKSKSISNLK